ncbi:MAG: zeta toxin family protein [Hyphomicrobiaceae bacterium]
MAGPNGAGKTTFAQQLLTDLAATGPAFAVEFLNADEIERRLRASQSNLPRPAIAAGRELLGLIDHHLNERNDFMVETTLSSTSCARQIPNWSDSGYHVELYCLRLPSVEASIERVRRRVAAGGHGILEADLRRRFAKSLHNLEQVYKPVVDKRTVYDSLEGKVQLAATGGRSS